MMFKSEVSRRQFVRETAAMIGATSAALTIGAARGADTAGRERWLIVAAHPDDEAKASALIFSEGKRQGPDSQQIHFFLSLFDGRSEFKFMDNQ